MACACKPEVDPEVGQYRVNMEDLNIAGAQAVIDATENCDAVAADEVGPMEVFSAMFKKAVQRALESRKPVLAAVH
jgi:nucleoside-triphosphatase